MPCLTDDQLSSLGVNTIGDKGTLRQRCQGVQKVYNIVGQGIGLDVMHGSITALGVL